MYKAVLDFRTIRFGRKLSICIVNDHIFLVPMGRLKTEGPLYSGPCILRTPLLPEIVGLKLQVVLKWRDIYIENVKMVSLIVAWS